MNIPVLIVACISLLALMAHTFVGTKENASISPNEDDEKLNQNWKQSMCAFQMLTIDLLLVTVTLFAISLTDIISFEYELTLFLSFVFFLWGIIWLIQLFWLKSKAKTYLLLSQWVFWFVCSGLLYWGGIKSLTPASADRKKRHNFCENKKPQKPRPFLRQLMQALYPKAIKVHERTFINEVVGFIFVS